MRRYVEVAAIPGAFVQWLQGVFGAAHRIQGPLPFAFVATAPPFAQLRTLLVAPEPFRVLFQIGSGGQSKKQFGARDRLLLHPSTPNF